MIDDTPHRPRLTKILLSLTGFAKGGVGINPCCGSPLRLGTYRGSLPMNLFPTVAG